MPPKFPVGRDLFHHHQIEHKSEHCVVLVRSRLAFYLDPSGNLCTLAIFSVPTASCIRMQYHLGRLPGSIGSQSVLSAQQITLTLLFLLIGYLNLMIYQLLILVLIGVGFHCQIVLWGINSQKFHIMQIPLKMEMRMARVIVVMLQKWVVMFCLLTMSWWLTMERCRV
jgi:hypothetical protein